jgi:hypothetical protein
MERRPQFYLLRTDFRRLEFTDDTGRRAGGPIALGRALTSSPAWGELTDAVLVVRTAPTPLAGVLGYLDGDQHIRLGALAWQLKHMVPRLRYVTYRQAERACERLASELIATFGREAAADFRYLALPRGGVPVLGMLSYLLDLKADRLEAPHPVGIPLVVVDDRALTGVRFRTFLRRCPSQEIIFAHLWSHPELREAIQLHEPRVRACLAAEDLLDHAPDELGDGYCAWRERRLRRSPEAYWVGLTEHICFPWSEPDVGIWNPDTGQDEGGWRLVPPELCLKNRPAPGAQPNRLHIQPLGPGPLRPAEDVLYGEIGDQLLVANVTTQEVFALSGVAASMWKAISTTGRLGEVLMTISQQYDVDARKLRNDLQKFVGELVNRKLLEVAEV